METDVLFEIQDGIGTVTLNRPESRNALTFEMYERLKEICTAPSANDDVKALIVTGAGSRAFAAGTDIAQFRGFKSAEDALNYEHTMDSVFTAIETCPVPTIAAIAGACTGGGTAIAAACDIRIATRDAAFGFPIARTLGNCLSLSNIARLVSLIGAGRVMDVVLTARLIRGEEAQEVGLVSEVLDDHITLMARARELAHVLASHAPLTIRATKEALRRLRLGRRDDEDLISMCYTSEDFREGLESFLAKRKPHWKGR